MQDDDAITEAELDRLLNDPEVPMQAWRVWALADKLAEQAAAG